MRRSAHKKDGRTVTMGLGGKGDPGLVQIDIGCERSTQAPLPADLKEESIYSLAAGSESEVLFLAKKGVGGVDTRRHHAAP